VTLPNAITLFRLFLVPVVGWLIMAGHDVMAFLLFLIAGLSDGLDGYLAKHFHWESELGAYLDPLADKCLLVVVFITLAMREALPMWIVGLVIARDVLIVIAIAISWLVRNPIRINPLWISKANTVAQIALAAAVLAYLAIGRGNDTFIVLLAYATVVLTLASLVAYFWTWVRHLRGLPT